MTAPQPGEQYWGPPAGHRPDGAEAPSYGEPGVPTYGEPGVPTYGEPGVPTYDGSGVPTYGDPPAYGDPGRDVAPTADDSTSGFEGLRRFLRWPWLVGAVVVVLLIAGGVAAVVIGSGKSGGDRAVATAPASAPSPNDVPSANSLRKILLNQSDFAGLLPTVWQEDKNNEDLTQTSRLLSATTPECQANLQKWWNYSPPAAVKTAYQADGYDVVTYISSDTVEQAKADFAQEVSDAENCGWSYLDDTNATDSISDRKLEKASIKSLGDESFAYFQRQSSGSMATSVLCYVSRSGGEIYEFDFAGPGLSMNHEAIMDPLTASIEPHVIKRALDKWVASIR
jgi:hypothetical protein